MSVSFSVTMFMGAKVDDEDLYEREWGRVSCDCDAATESVKFCPDCGAEVRFAWENYKPKFDIDAIGLEESDLSTDCEADGPTVVGVSIYCDAFEDIDHGIVERGFDLDALCATKQAVEAKLKEAGLDKEVRLYVTPYVSY